MVLSKLFMSGNIKAMKHLFLILLSTVCLGFSAQARAADPQVVTYSTTSDGLALKGYLYLPKGHGPFPAVLWNHGSEKLLGTTQPDLADFYTSHGFAFFVPNRRGHGLSPGPYIMDKIRLDSVWGLLGGNQKIVELQEQANQDVTAGVSWLSSRSFVDPKRIVMSGCSFGGIQTLLAAEKPLGVRAYVAFAPGAESWGNGALREKLLKAVQNAKAPVFILQAANDYNLGPVEILGPEAQKKGGLAKKYPAFGTSHPDGHWRFATLPGGIAIWGPDVLAFIHRCLK